MAKIDHINVWDKRDNILTKVAEMVADAKPARYFKNPDTSAVFQLLSNPNFNISLYKFDESSGKVLAKTQADLDSETALKLPPIKAKLVRQVDAAVEKRIAEGSFTHESLEFSITPNAQIKWIGLHNAKDAISYPLTVFTKDDSQSHDIADAAEVTTVYIAAVEAVRTELDAGVVAKAAILAAADADAARTAFDSFINP